MKHSISLYLSIFVLLAAACGYSVEEEVPLSKGELVSLEDGQHLFKVGEGIEGSLQNISILEQGGNLIYKEGEAPGVSAQLNAPANCKGSLNCGTGMCSCTGDPNCCSASCKAAWGLCGSN